LYVFACDSNVKFATKLEYRLVSFSFFGTGTAVSFIVILLYDRFSRHLSW
jgi:hypothetical protein